MGDAISKLIYGTIDLGPTSGGGGNRNFSVEQRTQLSTRWKEFLDRHQKQLKAGKKLPPPEVGVSHSLIGMDLRPNYKYGAYHVTLKDGSSWPPLSSAP